MKFIILPLLLLFSFPLSADIVVIGHLQNTNPMMTAREVQDIYMGRQRTLADNSIAYPVDNKNLRNEFYTLLVNRPIEQVNAYWARLKFSGQRTQPEILLGTAEIISKIRNNKNAISYVNKQDVKESEVRILFIIKDHDGTHTN